MAVAKPVETKIDAVAVRPETPKAKSVKAKTLDKA